MNESINNLVKLAEAYRDFVLLSKGWKHTTFETKHGEVWVYANPTDRHCTVDFNQNNQAGITVAFHHPEHISFRNPNFITEGHVNTMVRVFDEALEVLKSEFIKSGEEEKRLAIIAEKEALETRLRELESI